MSAASDRSHDISAKIASATTKSQEATGHDSPARLRISEIFYSLQGESRSVGWPTVFVRLTGCPLRCGYCDTDYAFQGGGWIGLDDILVQVAAHSPRFVTVTGGEPLAQRPCLALLARLCDAGYTVSLETRGSLGIDPRCPTNDP